MKKLLIALFCFTCFAGFAQNQLFVKNFPGNDNAIYVTNSNVISGLVFVYTTASDTSKTVYFIEKFKAEDL